jgi:transcriptional repressor NrdR
MESEMAVRRRRECTRCGYRFTTFERIEMANLMVIKKDGTRQPYDREKMMRGIQKAVEKRPVSSEDIHALTAKVESQLRATSTSEVTSKQIGQLIMRHLKKLDKVAYIRYASVYKEFEDIDSLEEELHKLLRGRKSGGKKSGE